MKNLKIHMNNFKEYLNYFAHVLLFMHLDIVLMRFKDKGNTKIAQKLG